MEFFSLTSIKNCLEILVMDRTVLESEAKLLKHYYLTFEKKKTFCRKRKKQSSRDFYLQFAKSLLRTSLNFYSFCRGFFSLFNLTGPK